MRENTSPYTDDRALMRAAGRGSPDAWATLVRRYQDEAVRVAFLLTGRQRQAAEHAAAALLDVFREMRRSDPEPEFRPWLPGSWSIRVVAGWADGQRGEQVIARNDAVETRPAAP